MREILTAFTGGSGVAMLSDLKGVRIPDPTGWLENGTDPSTPPKPTGLECDGALANIILAWDETTYSNLSHTEIWAAQTDDFSVAQLIGRADGRVYVDNVGGAAVRYYWIRYISRANVAGPFNLQEGTRGETSPDPKYLLELLTGQITESQLYADLGDKIELITGPSNLPGSVAQRIAAEALARATAIAGEAATRAAAIVSEQQARVDADGALSTRLDALVAVAGDNAAAITAEQTARADADGALSRRVDTLAASAGANEAAIVAEQKARADADGANATQITQLQAVVSDPATGLTAKYAAVKTTADATATALGKVQAKYTVNVDVNGVAGGFGIIGTGDGLQSTIDFGVRANSFFVAAPSGSGVASTIPFVVRTTATVINGVNVPAGVYIADAMIGNGTITNAKIGDAAIDNAKIASLDAGKINTGYLDAARIKAGSLTANLIDTRGLTIKDVNGNVIFGAGTALAYSNITGGPPSNANYTYSTSQLTDGAGLGNTAIWSSVSGSGKPENNATNGATFGVNIGGKIVPGTASTYIADGAIQNAQIGYAAIHLANINTATIGNLSAMTASIGLLRTASSGGRTEIQDNVIRVYDNSNVLRVKLGNLA
jgi:hypothetical protein